MPYLIRGHGMSKVRSALRRTSRGLSHLRAWLDLLAALAATVVVPPTNAQAHAIVVVARPAMGSTVMQGGLGIRLDFNSLIDHQRSRLRLRRPDGSEASVAVARNSAPNVLAGSAETTISGRWGLEWQVLSVDGHITRGEVKFTVRDKASSP